MVWERGEAGQQVRCMGLQQQRNKMLESSKAFSKSLRKLINRANPEQRQLSLYFRHTASPLPSLSHTHSQKLTPHQPNIDSLPDQPPRDREASFSDRVDDIVHGLLKRGEVQLELRGKEEKEGKRKGDGRLRNLRVVTEASEQRQSHKRSEAFENMQTMMLSREATRQRLLRRKFVLQNPQVQKKVDTRWGQRKAAPSKDMLSYYPIVDLRQENQELLLNMPAKSEDYLRKLRQTALHKLMKQ